MYASDGSSFPTAQIACYSADGEKKWEKEENYEEPGILFDAVGRIPGGYIAAGATAAEKSSVRMVRYDENGTKVSARDEPLSENPNYVEHLELQRMNDVLYLVVTADYQTDTAVGGADHITLSNGYQETFLLLSPVDKKRARKHGGENRRIRFRKEPPHEGAALGLSKKRCGSSALLIKLQQRRDILPIIL